MSIDVTVTLENTGIGDDLELPVTGIEVVDWVPPEESRSRQTAASLFVDGEAELSSTLAAQRATLVLRCVGTPSTGVTAWKDACASLDTIRAAACQRAWTLTVEIDGVTDEYSARAADVVSPVVRGLVHRGRRDVTLSIPVDPAS